MITTDLVSFLLPHSKYLKRKLTDASVEPRNEPKNVESQPQRMRLEELGLIEKQPVSQENIHWKRGEWSVFVELCLEYLADASETVLNDFTMTSCQPFEKYGGSNMFGYFFRGKFLPSGNSDGVFWRPSRNVKINRGRIMKRYFYGKTSSGIPVKRQVSWLSDRPEISFVEYRFNGEREVDMKDLGDFLHFEWKKLIKNVFEFHQKSPEQLKEEPSTVPVKEEYVHCLFDSPPSSSDGENFEQKRSVDHTAEIWESELYEQFAYSNDFFNVSGEWLGTVF